MFIYSFECTDFFGLNCLGRSYNFWNSKADFLGRTQESFQEGGLYYLGYPEEDKDPKKHTYNQLKNTQEILKSTQNILKNTQTTN